MLSELHVRDLGVIEDLTLSFGSGMTALSGETGAGKTLVVEALQLLLGGKARPSIVRSGSTEALVEARFVIGHDDDEREVIVSRTVAAQGRSRAWVDSRMTPIAALFEVAGELVEIHGQHEHQSLVSPAAQRAVLDAYAGTDGREVTRLRARLRELATSLDELGGDEQQRARESDVLRYQIDEIKGAGLFDPNEDAALYEQELRLADAGDLRHAAARAVDLLDLASGEGGGVTSALGEAESALGDWEAFGEFRARLAAAAVELADVAQALRDVVEGWEDDPARLAEVQERRRRLAELRRKYGEDLAAVIDFGAQAAARLDELENAEALAADFAAAIEETTVELARAERVVRATRAGAAEALASAVRDRLATLAMPGARIEVRVGADGTGEPIELALGANVGEAVLPLAKAASGGELSRAMLAIRLVAMHGPTTMVFDEVDAGVGGASALALGEALREASIGRQVIVVTHLAQVAACADHQISIEKSEVAGRTVTTGRAVHGEDRVVELSRMLSGHPDSESARAHARELLEASGSETP